MNDMDNKEIKYGSKSKQYKEAYKKTGDAFGDYVKSSNNDAKEFNDRVDKFIQDKLGNYANKKISGLNVPGANKTAGELLKQNASNYWYQYDYKKLHDTQK